MHPKSFVSNFWGAVQTLLYRAYFYCIRNNYPTCEPGFTLPVTVVTFSVPSKFTAERIIP